MKLSADGFARLVQGVEFVSSPAVEDRRQHRRVAMGQRGQVRAGDGAWRTVVIRDLSVDGVGVRSEARMAVGEPFVLRLGTGGGRTVDQPCLVRWCEPGGFETVAYFVGAAFVEPPPPQGEGPRRPSWVDDFLVDLRLRAAVARGV